MQKKPHSSKSRTKDADMTPMVDVTFLLLIFFVVTASFQLQKAISMPKSTSELPSPRNVEFQSQTQHVEVHVDEFGCFYVLGGDWRVEATGKQNLIRTLRHARTSSDFQLTIKVHHASKLQSLVDAMDAGSTAGYTQVRVMQVDLLS